MQKKKGRLSLLKQNLLLADISIEKYTDSTDIVLVAINDHFKTRNNNTYRGSNTLFLIVTKSKLEIKVSKIGQFISNDENKNLKAPSGSYSKIFKSEKLEVDGTFTFLTPADGFLFELGYSKGQLNKYKYYSTKSSNKNISGRESNTNSGCTDWYIVTTLYVNGIQVSQTEKYVYTTCGSPDGCSPSVPDPNTAYLECPDNNATGGNNSDQLEVTNVSTIDKWLMESYRETTGSGNINSYDVFSYELVKGIKPPAPANTTLTSIEHITSSIVSSGLIPTDAPSHPFATYQELAHAEYIQGGSSKYGVVYGTVTFHYQTSKNIDKAHLQTASVLFP